MWEAATVAALLLMMLAAGFFMGIRWSRSASQAEREGAESTLQAAQAVSSMTVTMAEHASQQASIAETLQQQLNTLQKQATEIERLAESMQRMADTQVVMTETFVNRGLMRAATTPAQVGETVRPMPQGPAPPPVVQKAGIRNSPSPREPSATG